MAIDAVLSGLEALITEKNGSGQDLEFLQGLGVEVVPPSSSAQFPYVVIRDVDETEEFATDASKFHSVGLTISLLVKQKDDAETRFASLKSALATKLEDPQAFSQYITSDQVCVWDISFGDTNLVPRDSHIWEYAWILEFKTKTLR
ncbi:MAG: hypothetical protein CMK32_09925 [Porticoccaceae bacterium]|nr:hypothetical protein [Porticoccaceae bacterium]